MRSAPRTLPIRRPTGPRIPQALAFGIVLVALGILLDQIWPQQLLFMTVRTGVGPIFDALGLTLAMTGVAPVLFRKDSQRWRDSARQADERARRREQRARAQEDAHTRFMRELEHELKNPLQAMKSAFAEIASTDAESESVRTARAQVERLRQLTSSLRQVANVVPERLEREKVDLNELVTEAVELARAAAPQEAERIHIMASRIQWRTASVVADRELLSQAVFNLLDNALKYSPTESIVEVRLHEDGRHASVEVVDAGRGIDEKDLPHVTEELFRGDRTDGVEGSGLGLALVHRVALAHGGELKLRSHLNKGTVAQLELPIA